MSILIEGLTLPPVGVRQYVVAVSGGHLLISDVCGNTLFEDKYIEISTPHGRLIDADFLVHMLNLALMPIRHSAGVDIDSMNEDQKIFVRTVINQIKSAPTIIEAEVSE